MLEQAMAEQSSQVSQGVSRCTEQERPRVVSTTRPPRGRPERETPWRIPSCPDVSRSCLWLRALAASAEA